MGGAEIREHDLVREAWREFRASAGYSQGRTIEHLGDRPPRWFVDEELGFGPEHWPSLMATCRGLTRQNALAVERLLKLGGPPRRVTYPANFRDPRDRRGKRRR